MGKPIIFAPGEILLDAVTMIPARAGVQAGHAKQRSREKNSMKSTCNNIIIIVGCIFGMKLNRFFDGLQLCRRAFFLDGNAHRCASGKWLAHRGRETRLRRIARLRRCRGGRSSGCAAAMQFRLPSAAARSGRGKRCRARHISPVRGNLRRCFGLKVAAGFRFSVNVSRLRSREVSTVSPARYHFCAKIVAFTRTARNSKLHIRILYFASGPL